MKYVSSVLDVIKPGTRKMLLGLIITGLAFITNWMVIIIAWLSKDLLLKDAIILLPFSSEFFKWVLGIYVVGNGVEHALNTKERAKNA